MAQTISPDDPLAQLELWLSEGRKTALATVVATWGSSPRPVGSHLALTDAGDFVGSVSGGCIEGAVIQAGLDCIKSGRPVLLAYGVTNEMAWDVGLACGGEIKVFVEPVTS